ncbi:MAG: nuclear transport factor 2 family protein [Acidobacteria bacterium]|nr:nuclear transport factor 2 family protein [Acidobacteriota bacterium]
MTPEETREVVTRFYDALTRRDGETMAACYAENATFDDPAFSLRGADCGKMWIGLMRRAKDFSAQYTIAKAGSGTATVEWTARYLFGGKNPVTNVILSELVLENGRIVKQVDTFDFPRWAGQALGLPGKLFARFAWFQAKVRKKAAAGLGLPSR